MAWPLSQDYNEAIQDPTYCFADPDLRAGHVVTNALGLPAPRSGSFADVYQVRAATGERNWAVKCFTRAVPGQRERYAAISAFLAQARLRFMVDFRYLEPGIRVAGTWYPVLKMDWVEGFLLNEFVGQQIDRPAMLEALADLWARMARRLYRAGLAHGDLQHGNVLLVPGRDEKHLGIRLIDYDGMIVPALAAIPSGEAGHPAYQHPQRLRDGTYNQEVDRFPLLVVYVAIRALTIGGRALWERYDNGDNLLFCRQDFEAPTRSPLFAELLKLDDAPLRNLAEMLIDATRQALAQTPLLEELTDRDAEATSSGASEWWKSAAADVSVDIAPPPALAPPAPADPVPDVPMATLATAPIELVPITVAPAAVAAAPAVASVPVPATVAPLPSEVAFASLHSGAAPTRRRARGCAWPAIAGAAILGTAAALAVVVAGYFLLARDAAGRNPLHPDKRTDQTPPKKPLPFKPSGALDSSPRFDPRTLDLPDDVLVADFEGSDYGNWQVTGTAFGQGPAPGTLPNQMPVTGYLGNRLVNSFHGGDASIGTLTSPPFKIERRHLKFLIGGGKHDGETCINLFVGTKCVRTATGPNDRPGGSERLSWHTWDVAEFGGQDAIIQIVDNCTGPWGHINIDHILQSSHR